MLSLIREHPSVLEWPTRIQTRQIFLALPGIEWVILEGESGEKLVDSGFSGF
jgi:hypothetical protein